MNERQAHILRLIVEDYTRFIEPVSSQALCDRYHLPCSSATVRNDMATLEAEGYLHHPHTSAGRVPTETAYRYYVDNATPVRKLRVTISVSVAPRRVAAEERLLALGGELVRASSEAVVLATSRPWSITLGLANLLRKPDFRSPERLDALAEDLERFDDALAHFPQRIAENGVTVFMGDNNPFGSSLATVAASGRMRDGTRASVGIVGPLRMDYRANIALVTRAKEILES